MAAPIPAEPPHSSPPSGFVCPACRAPVRAADWACPACGVNLAWAATTAERRVLDALPPADAAPPPAAVILPRFGEFLLRRGDISEAQLREALARQRAGAAAGDQRTVGQILLEMGAVSRAQLDHAGFEQVRQLQEALQESNRDLERKVTERTRELQQALQQLAVLSDLRANFVTNLSHILRTPLTSIKGFSALLASQAMGPLSPPQRQAAETIAQSAQRLETTINEILHFIPGARNQLVIQRGEVALGPLAELLQARFAERAAASKVRLRLAVEPGLPPLWADEEKLRWALSQLLDSAIRFTPSGGEVALEARRAGAGVRVAVCDSAPALAPEILDETPALLPEVPEHLVENVRLGLTLVKRIVEAHHAHLEIESPPGDGTVFAFLLPAAGDAAL